MPHGPIDWDVVGDIGNAFGAELMFAELRGETLMKTEELAEHEDVQEAFEKEIGEVAADERCRDVHAEMAGPQGPQCSQVSQGVGGRAGPARHRLTEQRTSPGSVHPWRSSTEPTRSRRHRPSLIAPHTPDMVPDEHEI